MICPKGTCEIRKIVVRYNVGGRVFGGNGTAATRVPAAQPSVVRATVPPNIMRMLRQTNRAAWVTVNVTVESATGNRTYGFVRTGLRG